MRRAVVIVLSGLLACATPGRMRVEAGVPGLPAPGASESSPLHIGNGSSAPLASTSLPERIDVYAGVLIAIGCSSEDLRAEVDNTRRRRLVWRGERDTIFGRVKHQVDWNPALEYLSRTLDEVDAWKAAGLNAAASAHAGPSRRDEIALQATLSRIGEALRVVGVYLAAIRAAQYALHDAPSYVAGGLGFNDGLIERAERLRATLDALRAGADPAQLAGQTGEAIDATSSYIDSYFRGLQDGAHLLEAARVVALVQGAVGTVQALAGIARLLAGAAVESGGMTYALAGASAGGTGVGAGAGAASIQGILKGVAVATALGTASLRG